MEKRIRKKKICSSCGKRRIKDHPCSNITTKEKNKKGGLKNPSNQEEEKQ